jgi:hypothetical protein
VAAVSPSLFSPFLVFHIKKYYRLNPDKAGSVPLHRV